MANKKERKDTLVSYNFEARIEYIKGDEHLVISAKGISHKNASSNNTSYANQKTTEIYLPLWMIPYFMRKQREAIALYEKGELDKIARIKNAYNTPVELPKK